MYGHIFAIIFLIFIILSCYIVKKYATKFSIKNSLYGILFTTLMVFVWAMTSPCLCRERVPLILIVLPALFILVISAAVPQRKIRKICCYSIAITAFILTEFHATLHHGGGYTSRQNYAQVKKEERKYIMLSYIKYLPYTVEYKKYPAGWVKDMNLPLDEKIIQSFDISLPEGVVTHWHSFFTSLYKKKPEKNYSLWFPGGIFEKHITKAHLKAYE
ncbi:hypothetical protein [Candidatus Uabimicrobium amorphum]|uniref:Uncharacterized protein n=1 Tax=Uabimicrobium amorphum TaxID=2596890 RepID=A0A5S9IVC1_UABAM|nr:hypothetical protein [Candidatus Uabimicrobium amorphum]BBM87971.1 hypothetical protein UABAM_06387 [Candidatus Uabimicrobium amorphum]